MTGDGANTGHGNKNTPHTDAQDVPQVRKVRADSVPFGEDICRHGKHVWCAYDGDVLIAVTATADEARRKWRVYQVQKRIREQKGSSAKC